MNSSSLRLRLLIAWAVFIFLALQVAGVGLRVLFERSITRRTIAELEFDLRQLTNGLRAEPDGRLTQHRRPTDPQFEVANGGRYWQVSDNGNDALLSVSLNGRPLKRIATPPADGSSIVTRLVAPDHHRLLAVVRRHTVEGDAADPRNLTIVSAVNASEITEDTEKFTNDLLLGLLGLAGLLLLGAWVHVTVGLRPLNRVRQSLTSIRSGETQRIDSDFPQEMMPLVDETNALLDAQDRAIEAARARAGDLAHGLKTPLAIMAAKSRSLRSTGQAIIADEIDRQIETMRRHVQRELARARARGKSRGSIKDIDLSVVTREMISAIQTLPLARNLEWDLDLTDPLPFPVDRADFNDILGNLVDNAQKWARSMVRVSVQNHGPTIRIDVEDDGPGVEETLMDEIAKRGVTSDPGGEGAGLGLAIVGDLIELYGGKFTLSRSSFGGLHALAELPGRRMDAASG